MSRPRLTNPLTGLAKRLDGLSRELASLGRHFEKRLDSRVGALKRQIAELRATVDDVDRNLQALLRREALGDFDVPHPYRLTAQRWRALSHQEEDGLTLALLRELGDPVRRAVEIGCGTNGGNSGFLATELGWACLMIDAAPWCTEASAKLNPETITAVTREIGSGNVDATLSEHGFSGEVDLLSIDIDSVDYWVWEAQTVARPRIVIAEYNAALGPDRALTIPENPSLARDALPPDLRGLWFGASLQALDRLAARKGYRLVAVTPAGVNAYFLRDDLAPHLPALDARRAWRPLEKLDRALAKMDGDDPLAVAVSRLDDLGYRMVDVAGAPAA
jgi:hypothetical protein